MKYTHEQRAALHIARAEKAQARADAAKATAQRKRAAIYSRAVLYLGSALEQMRDDDPEYVKAYEVRERLKTLYSEAIR